MPFILGGVLILLLAIGGGVYRWNKKDLELRQEMLWHVTACGAALGTVEIDQLKGESSDLTSPAYLELVRKLRRLRSEDARLRFAYIMRQVGAKRVIYVVDSEPSDSKDFSPPGQVYEESDTDDALLNALSSRTATVGGPLPDEYGTWVTAFAPLIGARGEFNGNILGLDIAARDWNWLVAQSACVTGGGILMVLGIPFSAILVARQRIRNRAALSQVEERHRRLVEQLPAVTYIAEPGFGGRWLFVSPQIEPLLGYSPKEWSADPRLFAMSLHPEDREGVLNAQNEAAETGGNFSRDFRLVAKNGETIWCHSDAGVLSSKTDGRPLLQGVLSDVTEQRRAMEELAKAKAAAEEASRAKSEFLAMMSHEIRTPMNGVIGMTSVLLETKLQEDQKDYVETIRTSGENLLGILNSILDFSKIEAGRMELENSPFDLEQVIEGVLELFASTSAARNIELLYYMEPGVPPVVVGDATRLRQILCNLLSNALKFTQTGEVEVTVRALQNADPSICELAFSVRDTGIGIPADRLDRLFRVFSQVDSSTNRRFGGTGLGLAISKRLAEMMGGRMWVESRPKEGATFYFTIVADCFQGQVPPTEADWSFIAGRRLLIVDDNESSRHLLRKLLERHEALVTEAPDGREALALQAKGQSFEACLVDIQMPEMNGIDAINLWRSREFGRQTPMLCLTSIGGSSWRQRVESTAATRVVEKPVRPTQLLEKLKEILDISPKLDIPQEALSGVQRVVGNPAILLAEDNSVNQLVAREMLRKLGCRADIVANGTEVIAAFKQRSYDIILMDVQMPELSGFEATQRLRATLTDTAQPWIIAITANALKGDREACLIAGMDDYIPKPLRLADLEFALNNGVSQLRKRGRLLKI